jgi:hypothetical protein
LVERNCFEEVGFFDENMRRLEDWDWMLRYTARYKLTNVDEALATIFPNAAPSHHDVLQSLDFLRNKHLPSVTAMGRAEHRRFMSALLLEESASWYREAHLFRAITTLARSYFYYPLRSRSFYSNAVRKLAKLIHSKIGWRANMQN